MSIFGVVQAAAAGSVIFEQLEEADMAPNWGAGGQVVHNRSHMTIDSCIPTTPRGYTSGFLQLGTYCMHQQTAPVVR